MEKKKRPVKKENKKIAKREISNGAFVMIIVFCVIISGIIGWILGNCAYILGI